MGDAKSCRTAVITRAVKKFCQIRHEKDKSGIEYFRERSSANGNPFSEEIAERENSEFLEWR